MFNFQTEDIDSEKEQDLTKHTLDTQNNTPDQESCISDTFDSAQNEEAQNTELVLLKQRQFIEKLHRLSNLKRKSEEFLQNNYFADVMNSEKRPKVKEKPFYNSHSNSLVPTNNFENINVYDETPVDITTAFNTNMTKNNTKDLNDKSREQSSPETEVELKTECDDGDIIVTDPAVCTTPKKYDSSKDNKKDLSMQVEYQSPQDSKYYIHIKITKFILKQISILIPNL